MSKDEPKTKQEPLGVSFRQLLLDAYLPEAVAAVGIEMF